MEVETFERVWFDKSNVFKEMSNKHTSGQVTIIGGGALFHGAPLLALKGASRIVGMVFFSTPDEDKRIADRIKAELASFIWIPKAEVGGYIEKSEAVLIGPGMMRSHIKEQNTVCDTEGIKTKEYCISLFKKYPNIKWVIDGGALQVIPVEEIPKGSVITPNNKEFEMLFGKQMSEDTQERMTQVINLAKKHHLVILIKDEVSLVSDGIRVVQILGGNKGLVKGGTGDVMAGLLVGFLAKNDPIFAAAAASYLVKKTAEKLASRRGLMFNADDLVDFVPEVYGELISRKE